MILGPTGIGKTAVAFALAEHWPLEVISADSRQVYRRLDIGTAKPPRGWLRRLPHFGLDLVDPGERYSAGRFAREAPAWLAHIEVRGRMPVVVGGTGLYVRALAEGLFDEPLLEPERRRRLGAFIAGMGPAELVRWAIRLDPAFRTGGRQRATRAIEIPILTGRRLSDWQARARGAALIQPWYVVLTVPRPVLIQRIRSRAEEMVRRGLIEEAAAVLADGAKPGSPGLDAIGPREAVEYLQGQRSRESVPEAITVATRQYAKRQATWFRHQLPGEALAIDAARPPEEVAAEIADRWQRRASG